MDCKRERARRTHPEQATKRLKTHCLSNSIVFTDPVSTKVSKLRKIPNQGAGPGVCDEPNQHSETDRDRDTLIDNCYRRAADIEKQENEQENRRKTKDELVSRLIERGEHLQQLSEKTQQMRTDKENSVTESEGEIRKLREKLTLLSQEKTKKQAQKTSLAAAVYKTDSANRTHQEGLHNLKLEYNYVLDSLASSLSALAAAEALESESCLEQAGKLAEKASLLTMVSSLTQQSYNTQAEISAIAANTL